MRNLVNFHASSRNSRNLHFDGLFLSKAYKDLDEKVKTRALMTLKTDAKFEEKLTLGSRNDMRNLVTFNASSGNASRKSKNLHFDVLLLSIAYRVSAKNVDKELSLVTLKKDLNFEEKVCFCLKNDKRNLVGFNPSSGKSENLQRSFVVKNDLWFRK